MKHGPIALVDEETPSVFLMPRGPIFDKVMSNLEEVKARGGPVIAVACEGDEEVAARAEDVIYVPEVPEYLQPLVSVIPLQLLAYHIALLRECDVDKPRHLAKSVTVEGRRAVVLHCGGSRGLSRAPPFVVGGDHGRHRSRRGPDRRQRGALRG